MADENKQASQEEPQASEQPQILDGTGQPIPPRADEPDSYVRSGQAGVNGGMDETQQKMTGYGYTENGTQAAFGGLPQGGKNPEGMEQPAGNIQGASEGQQSSNAELSPETGTTKKPNE